MTFDKWITQKGLSEDAVAALVGIHRSNIYRLRRGDTLPSWQTAAKIKEVTRGAVTADDFLPVLTA